MKTKTHFSFAIILFLSFSLVLQQGCIKEDEADETPEDSNTAPIASFVISPTTGNTQTNFLFDAYGSSDNEETTSILQIRWDWESDGTWDSDWSVNKAVNHSYSQEGSYTVTLAVKDTKGLEGTAFKSLVVSGGSISGQPCPGTPTITYHGQTYNTALIGTQCWMAENLNYEIGNSWCYDYNTTNCDKYGRLYEWETCMNGEAGSNSVPSGVQGICPEGWHMPSDAEWKILEGAADSQYDVGDSEWDDSGWRGLDAGKRLKATTGWSNNTGTDIYGFSASPGGHRSVSEPFFSGLEDYGHWWSTTENLSAYAKERLMSYARFEVSRNSVNKSYGLSVRCIKDFTK